VAGLDADQLGATQSRAGVPVLSPPDLQRAAHAP